MNPAVPLGHSQIPGEIQADSTADAAVLEPEGTLFIAQPFRILAPDTAQRASFQKYSGTDAAAVMGRKSSDVEYSACHIMVLLILNIRVAGAGDDLVLQFIRQFYEIGCVTGYPDG